MPELHTDDEIQRAISRLRVAHSEIETMLEQHDNGELEDYSSLVVAAESLLEHANAAMDRAEILEDADPSEES